MDGSLDRLFLKKNTVAQFPDQPDLTQMTQAALDILSKNPEGFLLIVEAGLVDKFSHPLDWERSVHDTIMFDKTVAIAQEFMKNNPDTLVIVTGDHTHSISIMGTVDDDKSGDIMRDKVGVYENAGFTNYQDSNGDGYPDKMDVSKRLMVSFGNFPDYYETFRPKLDGVFVPSIKNEAGIYIANEAYKDIPGAILRTGNLPLDASTGVHTVDDLVVQADGAGAERIRGYMENTNLFRIMAEAMGLGEQH